MSGFKEIHAHFVYGVDDGAQTREEMEALLDEAYNEGIGTLIATPHVTPAVRPFDWTVFEQRLAEARAYCEARGYPICLYAGAEVMYTPALEGYLKENELPTLGHSESVLMEFVPDVSFQEMDRALDCMERAGYRTIIAHIERYACLRKHGSTRCLKENHNARFQMNANTLLTKKGLLETWRIDRWFKEELVDFVASDAHHSRRRPFRIREAYQVLRREYGGSYAARVTGLERKRKDPGIQREDE